MGLIVLVGVILYGGYPVQIHAEFSSAPACEAAKAKLREATTAGRVDFLQCLPK